MKKHDDAADPGVTGTINDAVGKVGDKVATAYAAAREKASEAAHGTAATLDGSPLLALAGGLAIGAIAGLLVPRSERERSLLAPVGGRIADAARAAIDAAKTTGVDALADAGISEDNLRAQGAKLVEHLIAAASAAGSAAVDAARQSGTR